MESFVYTLYRWDKDWDAYLHIPVLYLLINLFVHLVIYLFIYLFILFYFIFIIFLLSMASYSSSQYLSCENCTANACNAG